MKIVIWGIGQKLQNNIDKIPFDNVSYLIDKDESKQGDIIYGKPIVPPEKLPFLEYDYIVIASALYFEEIAKKLLFEYGVECERIISINVFLQGEKWLELAFTQKIKKLCICYSVCNVLDIGGLLQKNSFWTIEKGIHIDALVKKNDIPDFLKKKYQHVYDSSEYLAERYNLIIDAGYYEEEMEIQKTGRFSYILSLFAGMDKWEAKEILGIYNTKFNISGIPVVTINKRKKDICIYQVTHKKFIPVKADPYKPIYVGKTDDPDIPYMRDTEGENISEFNDKINECTALYWIWKNDTSDYVGLNHYRRLFRSAVNSNWMLQDFEVQLLMEQYDIVVAEEYNTGEISVLQQLECQMCQEAFEQTYKVVDGVFAQIGGNDYLAFQYVMGGNMLYPCNMFITSRKILEEYCTWLFPILFQIIEKVEIQEEWDDYSKRVIGFFAERLLTVWLVQHDYKIKELPILFLDATMD